MKKREIQDLRQHYPTVIDMMDAEFSSHQFILRLAQYDQPRYVAALAAYCDGETPFKIVHQQLSAMLEEFPQLVLDNDWDEDSRDIFGNPNRCRRWLKVQSG
jgi:hypothetical protein